jgi:hypothetical protein
VRNGVRAEAILDGTGRRSGNAKDERSGNGKEQERLRVSRASTVHYSAWHWVVGARSGGTVDRTTSFCEGEIRMD